MLIAFIILFALPCSATKDLPVPQAESPSPATNVDQPQNPAESDNDHHSSSDEYDSNALGGDEDNVYESQPVKSTLFTGDQPNIEVELKDLDHKEKKHKKKKKKGKKESRRKKISNNHADLPDAVPAPSRKAPDAPDDPDLDEPPLSQKVTPVIVRIPDAPDHLDHQTEKCQNFCSSCGEVSGKACRNCGGLLCAIPLAGCACIAASCVCIQGTTDAMPCCLCAGDRNCDVLWPCNCIGSILFWALCCPCACVVCIKQCD